MNKTGQVSALVKFTFSSGETDSNCRHREIENTGLGESVLAGLYRVVWECLTSKGTFERRPHSEHLPPLGLPGPPACPGLGLTSPHHSVLHCSAPGTLAFLLFLKPAKLVPSSEPFRFPFLLPPDLRMARVLTSLRSLLHCPLLREALPHHPAFSGTATPHTALPLALPCFSSQCILQHNIISCLLVLSLTCKLHEDRDCVLFITVSQCSCQWCLLVHVLSPRFNGNDCGIFFSK